MDRNDEAATSDRRCSLVELDCHSCAQVEGAVRDGIVREPAEGEHNERRVAFEHAAIDVKGDTHRTKCEAGGVIILEAAALEVRRCHRRGRRTAPAAAVVA